ncbi:MAG: RluA family pseudouridine synthase [Aeriscardovia sp.]|nr:RluA family pseudouridine synthase [Aeriscardovia sp.]
MKKVVPLPENLAGERFDIGLARMLGISRAQAEALICKGEARLARSAKKSEKLEEGDVVTLEVEDEPPSCPYRPPAFLEILYQDSDIVVVNKPASLASHPCAGWKGDTVTEALERQGVFLCSDGPAGRRGVVSRLDVGTSGAMLLCKSNEAYVEMKRQFSSHEVEKTYHALASGYLREAATIEAPISRDPGAKFRFAVSPYGKDAVTHYRPIEVFKGFTLAEVKIETGRTHQIRVHFSSIGHPLAGDSLYGSNPRQDARLGLDRQWLHARSLRFRHPLTKIWMRVSATYSEDLRRSLGILESLGGVK